MSVGAEGGVRTVACPCMVDLLIGPSTGEREGELGGWAWWAATASVQKRWGSSLGPTLPDGLLATEGEGRRGLMERAGQLGQNQREGGI